MPAILVEPVRPGSQACIISHFTLIERMTNSQRLATVRERFLHWLQNANPGSLHTEPDDSLILRESMLIRDEYFCGRKFIGEHYNAVWFIEEDVLKIYQAEGPLELVLRGAEIDAYGAEPIEEKQVAEKLSVAPLAISEQVVKSPVVKTLSVTAGDVNSDDTNQVAMVTPNPVTPNPVTPAAVTPAAVTPNATLEDAAGNTDVGKDASEHASTNPPVATPETGPRILQLPAANGESIQPDAANADQIEVDPTASSEVRKAA